MATISHIDHIAIVVKSITEVRAFYEDALGLKIDHIEEMPKRGIKTAFITIGATKIELIEPLHEDSEVSKFIEKRGGGLHHVAFKTKDISTCQSQLEAHNVKLIYENAKPGAHDTQVNFVHPKSSGGVLVEIVQ